MTKERTPMVANDLQHRW